MNHELKNSAYWLIYRDLFELHKELYHVCEADDDYWERAFREANRFFKKYEAVPEGLYAKNLTIALMNELERKRTERG